MRRREFIALVGATAAWPLAAHAQQAAKLPTIGFTSRGFPLTPSNVRFLTNNGCPLSAESTHQHIAIPQKIC